MGGMWGAAFSDSTLFLFFLRLFFPHLRPTWQLKISTTEGSWKKCCHPQIQTHLSSRTFRLRCTQRKKTHTHAYILTLWLCKSCERSSTGSISPSFLARQTACRILRMLYVFVMRGFTCRGVWSTVAHEHYCALLTCLCTSPSDLFHL